MAFPKKTIADTAIISLLHNNNPEGWECLYDKYAPILFGAIFRIIPNKKKAKNLLMKSFIALKDTALVTQTNKSLLQFLLHHTYSFCIKQLSVQDINLLEEKLYDTDYPLINLFLFTPQSAKAIAGKRGVTETELKIMLLAESKKLMVNTNTEKAHSPFSLK
jgi:hypothetical protein